MPARPSRRRDQLLGIALTGVLALGVAAAAAAVAIGFGIFVVAMPLTTLAIAILAVWGVWRAYWRRRAR